MSGGQTALEIGALFTCALNLTADFGKCSHA